MKRPNTILVIIVAIGLFYTFTMPQFARVQELSLVADEYKGVLDNVERIAETRDMLLASYQAIPAEELDKLTKVLPNSVDSVRLALDIDTIASQYGITLKSVQVTTATEGDGSLPVLEEYALPYEKATVSFSFISNYENFVNLLRDLELSLRIMDIKDVSFETDSSGLYEHRVTLETYWLR